MEKEPEILKIVKEDILRLLAEEKTGVSLNYIMDDVKVSKSYMDKAINNLKKDDLILAKNGVLKLTTKGEAVAQDILKKHLVLEKYFEEIKSKKEAHRISHIIEHYISGEVLDNIKKLGTYKNRGLPLSEFEKEKGMITDIVVEEQLFERIISMGIFPGEKIRIIDKLPNGIVFKIRNKKIFLAKEVAEKINVFAYEKA
jgi:Mn-dependent DtxR family transcriptional regulator